jgi:hypothetical protein
MSYSSIVIPPSAADSTLLNNLCYVTFYVTRSPTNAAVGTHTMKERSNTEQMEAASRTSRRTYLNLPLTASIQLTNPKIKVSCLTYS